MRSNLSRRSRRAIHAKAVRHWIWYGDAKRCRQDGDRVGTTLQRHDVTVVIENQWLTVESLDGNPPPTAVNDCRVVDNIASHRQQRRLEGIRTVAENTYVKQSVVDNRMRKQLKASCPVPISADIDVEHLALVQDLSVDHDATDMWRVTVQSVECGLQQARSTRAAE